MNANPMSRSIIRFVAAPVAAAGIIGGAALGLSPALRQRKHRRRAQRPATYTGSADAVPDALAKRADQY